MTDSLGTPTDNEDSFREFYDQYADTVFGSAMAILRDSSEAEDVVQEVFIQAWRQVDRYDSSRGSVPTWLRTVARSRAIDRFRAIRRRSFTTEDAVDVAAPERDGSLDRVLSSERDHAVRFALAKLPSHQRRLLELSYDAGLSHSRIAGVLRQPLGTVKTHIRQALGALREQAEQAVFRPSTESEEEHDDQRLPFTITDEESLRTLPLSAMKSDSFSADLHGLRVLIVDDDAETRKLTAAVMTRFGAIVESHDSVRSALDEDVLSRSDVMIIDLFMPNEDGYAFLGAARALAKRQQLRLAPAIAFTASASEEERSRVRIAGFDTYLTKPVHPIALLCAVASTVAEPPSPTSI